jgi:hypothetical protein
MVESRIQVLERNILARGNPVPGAALPIYTQASTYLIGRPNRQRGIFDMAVVLSGGETPMKFTVVI